MNVDTFERLLKQAVRDGKTIRELRIRVGKPVMIRMEDGENTLFQTEPVEQRKLMKKKLRMQFSQTGS